HCAGRNRVRGILAEGTARSVAENRIQLIARRRVADVDFIARQQAVPLRSHVADLEKDLAGQLPLDRQVVLVGILHPQVRRKFTEEGHRQELRPIEGLSSRRIENAVERIGEDVAALVEIRCLQQRARNKVAASKWRFGTELFEYKLFNRVVEDAVARADA